MFIGKMFDKIRGGECLFVLGENRAGRCWRCWRCGGLRTVVLVWGGKEVDKNGRDGKRGNICLGEGECGGVSARCSIKLGAGNVYLCWGGEKSGGAMLAVRGLRTVFFVWGGKKVDKNGRDGKRGNIFLGERGMVCIGKEFDKIRSG